MWPGAGPAARTTAAASRRTVSGSVSSTSGSRLPCSATRAPTRRRASARSTVQSSPTPAHRTPRGRRATAPPPLVNTIVGTRRPSGPGFSAARTARIDASENVRYASHDRRPPHVSKIITASAPAATCSFEIRGDGLRVDGDEPREQVRPRVRHPPHGGEVGAAAALDHVARERERAARESDQRNAALERALDLAHRVEHIATAARGRARSSVADRRLVGRRAREARALALGERESEPHRVRHGQDVGEQDRRVERKAIERLQRDLRRERRRLSRARESCRPSRASRCTRGDSGRPGA